MMRMASSWRTTWTTNSNRDRSVYPIAAARASSSRQRRLGRKTGRRRPRRLPGMLHCACADSLRPSRNPIQRIVPVGLAERPFIYCIYIAYTSQGESRQVRERPHQYCSRQVWTSHLPQAVWTRGMLGHVSTNETPFPLCLEAAAGCLIAPAPCAFGFPRRFTKMPLVVPDAKAYSSEEVMDFANSGPTTSGLSVMADCSDGL